MVRYPLNVIALFVKSWSLTGSEVCRPILGAAFEALQDSPFGPLQGITMLSGVQLDPPRRTLLTR